MARRLLSRRASSVFSPPCRQVLDADSYESANRLNRKHLGKGLSKQSWYLIPKIRELDELLQKEERWRGRIVESHPELNFTSLNNGPLPHSKKTEAGFASRLNLLAHVLDPKARLNCLEEVMQLAGAKRFLPDDVLDALVLAWTAIHHESNCFLPELDLQEVDESGLVMSIACYDP